MCVDYKRQIHLKATVKTSEIWEAQGTKKDTERDANLLINTDCPGEWCKYEYLSLGPEKKRGIKQPREEKKT